MKNILEFIENSALKYPDKLAVADEDSHMVRWRGFPDRSVHGYMRRQMA